MGGTWGSPWFPVPLAGEAPVGLGEAFFFLLILLVCLILVLAFWVYAYYLLASRWLPRLQTLHCQMQTKTGSRALDNVLRKLSLFVSFLLLIEK